MSDRDRVVYLCYWLSIFMGLSVDIYLPLLPSIAKTFATDFHSTLTSLNMFLLGFGVCQLLYGPFSDHYGRKISLLIGLSIYFLSSLGCMLAVSLNMLTFFRFLQSLGACSAIISTSALARDVAEGKQLIKIYSNTAIAMSFFPAIAPYVGSFLDKTFGWRSVFFMATIITLITLVFIFKALRKNIVVAIRPFSLKNTVREYFHLFADKKFVLNSLIGASIFVALYFFLSSSPFLFLQTNLMNQTQYGIAMAMNCLALIVGYLLLKMIEQKLTLYNCMFVGANIMLLGSLAMWVFANQFLCFLFSMLMVSMGIGVLTPSSLAATLENQKIRSGQASALNGFIKMVLAVLFSSLLPFGFTMTAKVAIGCSVINLLLLCVARNYKFSLIPNGCS